MSTNYSISKKVNLSYEEAVAKTRDALKTEGFGVITEIDVKKTVREKLGEAFRPYVILGACNPSLAHKAISAEPEIGTLMPCNVCVWDNEDGTSTVAAVDVKSVFQLVQMPALTEIAEIVNARLQRAVEHMGTEETKQ